MFNAKELDEETGVYYYGARYLDPTEAMWLSVDPFFDKYAGMSPYNYCAGNPVMMIDPDGRTPDVIWDVLNVIYDAGAAIYNHVIGDHETAKEHWKDSGTDLVCAVIPLVPAGSTKAGKIVAKYTDDIAYATKTAATKLESVIKAGYKKVGDKWSVSEYRRNLQTFTKSLGERMDAHYIFPKAKEFKEFFEKAGIDVNNPEFMKWINPDNHRGKPSYNHLEEWRSVVEKFKGKIPTKEQLLKEAERIGKKIFGE